ncbi:MAG: tectonin domain-containing protein [Bryobacteraceae bacterium]
MISDSGSSPPGSLTEISTGAGDVWGLNSLGQIFQYNFAGPQWIQIAGSLHQITVGVNDVWGLDDAGNAYRYEGAAGFVMIVGGGFTQIVAGGNGVWGIVNPAVYPNTTILRLDPNVQTAVAVPGVLTQIASGYGAGVWGVNSADEVFTFVR